MSSEITAGLERKLRSVQDLIESKQYKKALKQCNQFLKKSPSPMLLCLKAYTLQKLGEEAESFSIIESLMSQKPSNPNLLTLAGMVYKALGRFDRLTQIQAESFASNPSREAGEQVFNSYASDYNFKEQYQVALKLYKTFNDGKYGLWAVESMALIAMNDPSQSKLLDLAGLFLNKIKQNAEFAGMREISEIEIFIEEVRGRTEKVVELLKKGRGVLSDGLLREAQGLEKLERLDEAREVLEMMIDAGNQDLKVFWMIADIDIKKGVNEVIGIQEMQQIPSWTKFEQIFRSESNSKGVKRTAQLSQIYIFTELIRSNRLIGYSELLLTTLTSYFISFYDIPSVVEDIKTTLIHLQPPESSTLLSSLSHFNRPTFSTQSELSKLLVYTRLSFKFSELLDNSYLISLYTQSLAFEQPPKKGEHRQGDYFLLVRSLNFPLSHSVPQVELEHGISQSTYNYFLKLQLIDNYTNTEFVRKLLEIYSGLDIKSVQHESLGYLVFAELNDWRLFKTDLSKLLTSCERFHKYYAIDLAETTSQAYFYSHVSQVLDFAKFKERIDKSLYFHMTQVTGLYLEIVKKLQEGPVKVNTDFLHQPIEGLAMNWDENVLNDYVPLKELGQKRERFGRWSDLRAFNFERLAAGFVCDFAFDEGKALRTLSKILSVVEGLGGMDEFFKSAFEALSQLMSGLADLKQASLTKSEASLRNCIQSLELLDTNLKRFTFWARFEQRESFVYEGFIKDLKKIGFLANTFAPLFSICLSFLKPLIPSQKSGKKAKQGSSLSIGTLFPQISGKLYRLFDDIISVLQNEEFLKSLDSDNEIPLKLSQVLIPEVNIEEKSKEIVQTRRLLIKDLCSEIHTIKSSSTILLNK